jgi:hypothetical protein
VLLKLVVIEKRGESYGDREFASVEEVMEVQ